jgi:hypothetical protein
MLSALLLGAGMALVRSAIPVGTSDAGWVGDPARRHAVRIALGLVPFAGIFFLWFMGSVRDYFGTAEDKFFATLFLGGGLLFVGLLFVIAAAAEGLLASAASSQGSPEVQHWRQLVLTLLADYATRMAAVLTLATTTMGHGLSRFPSWLVWFGYLVALVLLFVNVSWTELVFPLWVLTLSGYILLGSRERPRTVSP